MLGPNGAGKSTLLGLVTGSLRMQEGAIDVAGASGLVGYVPQDLQIDLSLTCREFLQYCAWLKRLPSSTWESEAIRVLGMVGLDQASHQKVKSLSGGMLRRLAVSQALLGRPGLIVLDEPTNALDPAQRHSLLQTIRMMSTDVFVLLSTHLVEDAAAVADSVVVLDQGKVAWAGPVTDLGPAAELGPRLQELFFKIVDGGVHDVDRPT